MASTRTAILTMAVTLLAGTASAQFAAGQPADVYDANGQRIGPYLDHQTTVVEFNGKSFEADFNDGAWNGFPIFFESLDCSGTPLPACPAFPFVRCLLSRDPLPQVPAKL